MGRWKCWRVTPNFVSCPRSIWSSAGTFSGRLPPYSPELNPIEGLWDQVQDVTCNRRHESLDDLEETLTAALRPFWETPARVLSLIHHWLHSQANAMPRLIVPIVCENWDEMFKWATNK